MTAVLEGIKVLDFGRFIAAPWCSAIMADMGADVIRIEKCDGGEDRWVQSVGSDGVGAGFLQCNRNKRSAAIGIASAEGREVVWRLVANADVVVANMPLQTLQSLGLWRELTPRSSLSERWCRMSITPPHFR